MGTTSYLDLSIASITERAERTDTSCSPDRPPKIMPTRSFFFISLSPSPRGRENNTPRSVQSYKIVFPNADRIISIPKIAVRLFTSSAVLISTTSRDCMPPASAIFSIARCASRYVNPPKFPSPARHQDRARRHRKSRRNHRCLVARCELPRRHKRPGRARQFRAL